MKISARRKTDTEVFALFYPALKTALIKAGLIIGLSCMLLGQELQRQGDARTVTLNDQQFIPVSGQGELTPKTTPKSKPAPVPLGTVARSVRERRDEQCHVRNMEGKRCTVRIVNDEGDQE